MTCDIFLRGDVASVACAKPVPYRFDISSANATPPETQALGLSRPGQTNRDIGLASQAFRPSPFSILRALARKRLETKG
jgi:hypothetical protein